MVMAVALTRLAVSVRLPVSAMLQKISTFFKSIVTLSVIQLVDFGDYSPLAAALQ
jgi:hypothetical protein